MSNDSEAWGDGFIDECNRQRDEKKQLSITQPQEWIDALVKQYAPVSEDVDLAIQNMGLHIANLKKRLAEAGWQPIETAPKDGTSVLVFPATWGSKSASIAKWEEDKYARKPRPYWSRDDDLGTMTISRKNPPTHWMPLPPPPQENTHD